MMKLKLNNIKHFHKDEYKKIMHNDTIFIISKEIINYIHNIRDKNFEKGGFLIGYKIKDVEQFTIKRISLPIKKDKSNIDSFVISKKHKRIVKKYLKNYQKLKNKKILVIGIWHTHPGTCLWPSHLDLKLYKRLSKKSKLKFSLNPITSSNKTIFIIYDNFEGVIKNAIIN